MITYRFKVSGAKVNVRKLKSFLVYDNRMFFMDEDKIPSQSVIDDMYRSDTKGLKKLLREAAKVSEPDIHLVQDGDVITIASEVKLNPERVIDLIGDAATVTTRVPLSREQIIEGFQQRGYIDIETVNVVRPEVTQL